MSGIAEGGQEDFGLAIRSAIRSLWGGQVDMAMFIAQMQAAMGRRLRQAWYEGAAACGVAKDELTYNETVRLDVEVQGLMTYIPPLAQHVMQNSKAQGGKLQPLLQRGEMWTARYEQLKQQGQALACADKKLEWVLGDAEHCSSCLKLNGKVKRASTWYDSGIIPRVAGADFLVCKGYRCQCALIPTTDKMSPGPLPNLP